ncbi:TPA: type B 50S ribosomal protein L31 [Candidatus Saccharibacteria bacterium]|nr:type B 50S ribosomal protein L31 [Candidatus Saccharibacteria bacterium]HIO87220.1 type B 50S ribosomal protein L31 [Candidatus Saccharibacteria bacterium]
MRKDLHPQDYRPVVFQDTSDGSTFLTKSTAKADDTIKWEDGNEYPLVKTHISSSSHPFYTGKEKVLDLEGRVDRFKAKAEKAKAAREAKMKAAAKKQAPKTEKEQSEAVKLGDKNAKVELKES